MKKIMFSDRFGLTQAVLEGRKTQTRRKVTLTLHEISEENELKEVCAEEIFLYEGAWLFKYKGKIYELPKENRPKYKVGEVVSIAQSYKDCGYSEIALDRSPKDFRIVRGTLGQSKGWKNKMFVRADACKHQICITNVRIERLQGISDEDCLAEGIIKGRVGCKHTHFMNAYYVPTMNLEPFCTPQEAYAALIDKVSGKGTWDSNPYVFVYDFEFVK